MFASSNGQLLTRLNYTSHIPCNGVEEPKSTESYGIGIQAVFKTPEGRKIGFGSESSDISLEGVKEALAKARIGAVLDPEFQSLARPTGEKRKLRRYHDPQLMRLADGDLVGAGWQVLGGALRTFETSEDAERAGRRQPARPGAHRRRRRHHPPGAHRRGLVRHAPAADGRIGPHPVVHHGHGGERGLEGQRLRARPPAWPTSATAPAARRRATPSIPSAVCG